VTYTGAGTERDAALAVIAGYAVDDRHNDIGKQDYENNNSTPGKVGSHL
jgi:hypothetical protein